MVLCNLLFWPLNNKAFEFWHFLFFVTIKWPFYHLLVKWRVEKRMGKMVTDRIHTKIEKVCYINVEKRRPQRIIKTTKLVSLWILNSNHLVNHQAINPLWTINVLYQQSSIITDPQANWLKVQYISLALKQA